ncbi:MAG: putative DNA binding domain-containing protein [Deltaproteobacteria bacterium]|nr:putative DNA binding domain-containing protein [Deltaproteobacteria bacterium]
MKSSKPWVARALQVLEDSVRQLHSEPNELDWKSAVSPNKERLVEHLSAFGNLPGGGFIVLGIDNATRQPRGVSQQEVDAAVTQFGNLGRDGLEPPVRIDHAVVEWRDANVLIVHIFEQATKPVHRRGQSIEHAWIRSGGATRKASRQEVGGMMLNSRPPRWEELRASVLLATDEILAKLNVAAICAKLERPTPDSPSETLRWLTAEKMVEFDGDRGFVTNFGAIAAANDLQAFNSLARKRIRVVRYDGPNKAKPIDEIMGSLGYAVGFEGLVARLKRVLPHSEVIREALRAQVAVYPEIALRELAANALIHQDFTITGAGPMIEIYRSLSGKPQRKRSAVSHIVPERPRTGIAVWL